MGDARKHRGRHPSDDELFGAETIERLRRGVEELSFLLGKGYNATSALKLVGDHYQLAARQRTALSRCACSDEQRRARRARRAKPMALAGEQLAIDAFNVLIGLESALAGGLVLRARDGAHRDLASIHGTYRKVEETRPAVVLVGTLLSSWKAAGAIWYLDRPVSNSGRLRALIDEVARSRQWAWEVRLEPNPDPLLAVDEGIVCSGDSWILDRCARSFDLVGEALAHIAPAPWLVDLG